MSQFSNAQEIQLIVEINVQVPKDTLRYRAAVISVLVAAIHIAKAKSPIRPGAQLCTQRRCMPIQNTFYQMDFSIKGL